MNKRKTGSRYEKIAAAFLTQSGYTVFKLNYRTKQGEIDIIAEDGDCICFIEVKYRRTAEYGYPSEAVDRKKQLKIIAASNYYLSVNGLSSADRRYDVVEILGSSIRIIKNSFGGS